MAWVRVEEDPSSNVVYVGSWTLGSQAGPSGGSYRYTDSVSGSVTFTPPASCSGLRVSSVMAGSSGTVRIYVDGVSVGTWEGEGTLTWQLIAWEATGLTFGSHSIKLENTTLNIHGNARAFIDFFEYDDAPNPDRSANAQRAIAVSGVGTPTIAPGAGWLRVEDDLAGAVYTGSWSIDTAAPYSGGTLHYTDSTSAYVVFTSPTGCTGLRVGAPKSAISGTVQISVDGSVVGTWDGYAASTLQQQIVWTVTGLTAGVHTIKVANTNTPSNPAGFREFIDFFEYTNDPPSSPDQNVTPTVAAAVSAGAAPTVQATASPTATGAAAVSAAAAPVLSVSVYAQTAVAVSGVPMPAPVEGTLAFALTAAAYSNALSPAFQISGNAPAQRAIALSVVPMPTVTTAATNVSALVAAAVSRVPFGSLTTTGGAVAYASSATATFTNATTVVVAKPTGLAAGDLLLLTAVAAASPVAATAPGGSVLLDDLGAPVLWSDGQSVTLDDGAGWTLIESVVGSGGGLFYDDAGGVVTWSDGSMVTFDAGPTTLLDELGALVLWSDSTPVLFDTGVAPLSSWLWRKAATSADVAAADVTVTFDRAASGVGMAARFTGQDAVPLDVVAHASGIGQDGQSAPGVTTTLPNDFVVRIGTWGGSGTATAPHGHTQRASVANITQAALATQDTFAATPGPVAPADYLNGTSTGWTHWTITIAQPLVGDRSITLPGAVRAVSQAPRPSLAASGNPTPAVAVAVSSFGGGALPLIMGLVAVPLRAAAHSGVGTPVIGGGAFGAGIAVGGRMQPAAAFSKVGRTYAYWRAPNPPAPVTPTHPPHRRTG